MKSIVVDVTEIIWKLLNILNQDSMECCLVTSASHYQGLAFILLWRSSFIHLFLIFLINFNWKIITLQYCDDFCHTSTWISHWYTFFPLSWTSFPPSLKNIYRVPELYIPSTAASSDAAIHQYGAPWNWIIKEIL